LKQIDIKEFDNLLKKNEEKIKEKYENLIYIHKRKRNGKKCITYLQNFHLDAEKHKKFMTNTQRIFQSSGSYKMNPEIDEKECVYIFNGDFQDILKEILIIQYKIDKDRIKCTGG
jgi:translation initiation factor 1 (eIF-1/SUI1)